MEYVIFESNFGFSFWPTCHYLNWWWQSCAEMKWDRERDRKRARGREREGGMEWGRTKERELRKFPNDGKVY